MTSKHSLLFGFYLVAFLFIFIQAGSQDQNWTNLRGSNQDGVAETENIPLKWDDSVHKMEN